MIDANVAIFTNPPKNQEISEYSSSQRDNLNFFDENQKFLLFLENNLVDLIIIDVLRIDNSLKELCDSIRKKNNYRSTPIIVNIDKLESAKDIALILNFGIDFLISVVTTPDWIEHFIEKHFEKIVDKQYLSSQRYQFISNQFNLIIEPKRAFSLLLSIIEEYAQAKDRVNTYIGMAAHDIRNPLSVILNATQLFLEKLGSTMSEEDKGLLGMVSNSSRYILQIIEEMLDISKLDSAKIQLKMTEIDFGELVKECYSINAALAKAQKIQMTLEIEENIPKIVCDEFKLKQVITNLLTNSIKFSHSDTVIKVVVSKDNEKCYLSVEDQGLGIALKDFSKVFQEFSSTDTKSVHGEKSTGLGLAIAKKIMDLHGGNISFSSEKNKGSVFTISLSLKPILKENESPS